MSRTGLGRRKRAPRRPGLSTRHAQGAWRHAALLRRGRPLGRRRDLDYASSSRARARLPVAPPARDATTRATSSRSRDVSADQLREQSLDACGWAELCEHLAEYASTRLGVEACRDLDLPSGGPWESELLLDETEAAIAMESHHGTSLDFGDPERGGASRIVQGGEVRLPRRR